MGSEVVKLHGAWLSPFVYRVIWALKLKGIAYEYVEEDLHNKSSLLLQYNPIHKKVPILVHLEKPICESMIILEYIEETWPHQCPLLPVDPYERSMARFWMNFAQEKDICAWEVFCNTGEEQDKAKRNTIESLTILEELYGRIGPDKKFFGGDKIGVVDIAFGVIAYWLEFIEETIGVKILDAQTFPGLTEWIDHFNNHPIIKENLPDRDRMEVFFKRLHAKNLASG